jgi:hypothetical protein
VILIVIGQAIINDFSADGVVSSLARMKLVKGPCLSAVNEKLTNTKKNRKIKKSNFLSMI